MILADKITQLRKKAGMSQEELADRIGVSRQAVSKWEGSLAVPDINKIIALSEVFGVSTDFLLRTRKTPAVKTARFTLSVSKPRIFSCRTMSRTPSLSPSV